MDNVFVLVSGVRMWPTLMLIMAVFWTREALSMANILFLFQKSECAYVVLIMAVFWITEALPISVTALLPVFLFPIVGLLSVKEASQQYINVSTPLIFT